MFPHLLFFKHKVMRREREVKSQSLHWWNMLGLWDQAFPQLLTLNSDIQEGTKLESYHGETLENKSIYKKYGN